MPTLKKTFATLMQIKTISITINITYKLIRKMPETLVDK